MVDHIIGRFLPFDGGGGRRQAQYTVDMRRRAGGPGDTNRKNKPPHSRNPVRAARPSTVSDRLITPTRQSSESMAAITPAMKPLLVRPIPICANQVRLGEASKPGMPSARNWVSGAAATSSARPGSGGTATTKRSDGIRSSAVSCCLTCQRNPAVVMISFRVV